MKTKGNWVIKYGSGVYFCGNSAFDKQLRKAKVYHWKEAAEEQAEHMRTKRYSPVVDETYEVVEISEPKELKDTKAEWIAHGEGEDGNEIIYECSNCRWTALNDYRGRSADSKFCPHCGKRMINSTMPEDN